MIDLDRDLSELRRQHADTAERLERKLGAGIFDLQAHAVLSGGAHDTRRQVQRMGTGFEFQHDLNE